MRAQQSLIQRNPTTRSATWILLALGLALLAGCRDFSFLNELGEVPRPLVLTPETVDLVAGQPFTFAATGGMTPYRYTVQTATGSTINAVSGLYVAGGTGTDTVLVTDAKGVSRQATINVSPLGGLFTVFPTSATVARNQSLQLTAAGGTAPYTFVLTTDNSAGASVTPGGLYTAGSTSGAPPDVVTVSDSAAGSIPVSLTVADLTTNVDYAVASTAFPANGAGGLPLAGGHSFTLENGGSANGVAGVDWVVYRSADGTLNSGDQVLCSGSHAALAAGMAAAVPISGTWPPEAASWYLIVVLSAADDLNPANNLYGDPVAVAVTQADIQYTVDNVNRLGGSTFTGGTASGDFRLRNTGSVAGSLAAGWTVLASLDAAASPDDAVIASGTHAALAATSNAVVPFSGLWPAAAGDYYLIAHVVAGDDAGGADNEAASAAVTTVTRPAVDYLPLNVTNMGGLTAGGALSGNFDLANSGSQDGVGPVAWSVFASSDNFLDGGDILVDTGSAGAVAGGSATPDIPFAGTWPLEGGPWRLFVKVTADDDVAHGNDAAFVDCLLAAPDVNYVVSTVARSGGVDVTGGPVGGTFSLQNIGGSDGHRKVFWTAYANTNPLLDGNEIFVAAGERTALTAGQLVAGIAFSGQWPAAAGSYHLLVRATADDFPAGHVAASVAVTAVQPSNVDYDVTATDFPAAGAAGAAVPGGRSFTIGNIGTGAGTQPVGWAVYVSSDGAVSAGDTILCSGTQAPLAAAGSALIALTGTWPAASGGYQLIVRLAAADDPFTANDTQLAGGLVLAAPDVDYETLAVTSLGPDKFGTPFSGHFDLHNLGVSNGAQPVYWTAYASTDGTVDGGDRVLAAGTAAAQSGGATLADIPFSATWPTTGGPYHLLVRASASDDVNAGNDTGDSGPLALAAPNVDYRVPTITAPVGTVAGEDFISSFNLNNNGTDGGRVRVSWTAYISTDGALDAGDRLFDSGSNAQLAAGGTAAGLALDGTWPMSPGTYHLIVSVLAEDDINAGNDWSASAPVTVDPRSVDYTVSLISAIGGTPKPGQAVSGSFQYRNNGANDGTQPVGWSAYASLDGTLDANDAYLASGAQPALPAGATSGNIGFAGLWPLGFGSYRVLIKLSAGDESNPADNTVATAGTTDVGIYSEGIEPNGDFAALSNFQDLGITLRPGMRLKVNGVSDNTDPWPSTTVDDIFGFNTGTANSVTISIDWGAGASGDSRILIMSGPNTFIAGVSMGASRYISYYWLRDAPGTMRYIDFENSQKRNFGSYTMIISAD